MLAAVWRCGVRAVQGPWQKEPQMEWSAEPTTLCAELLSINHRLFWTGYHQAAYHLLLAAVHLACDSGDVPTLRHIGERAAIQHQWVASRIPVNAPWGSSNDWQALSWTTLERLYATAEREANSKVALLERRNEGGFKHGG
jgi:hypothetical protein